MATATATKITGQKRQILDIVGRLKARGKAWVTTLEIAQGFGYSSAQSHLNTHINDLAEMGLLCRRDAEGRGRSRYEFALEA